MSLKCTCADLNWPCPKHGDQSQRWTEIVEHHVFVVRIYRRTSNRKYFSTVSKDAILGIETPIEYEKKSEAIAAVKLI